MAKPFADVTVNSDPARIHAALSSALTNYDERQSRGKYYNVHALAHYFGALHRAEESVQAGSTWRAALVESFTGRLLDAVLKAIGEPKSTRDEQRY